MPSFQQPDTPHVLHPADSEATGATGFDSVFHYRALEDAPVPEWESSAPTKQKSSKSRPTLQFVPSALGELDKQPTAGPESGHSSESDTVLLKKVAQGIQYLVDQQSRLEDLLTDIASMGGPRSRRESTESPRLPRLGGATPGMESEKTGCGDAGLMAMRISDYQRVSFALSDRDGGREAMDCEVEASISTADQWPATILPRHPPPMELAQEDDKLVLAMTRMNIGASPALLRSSSSNKRLDRVVDRFLKIPVFHPNSSKVIAFDVLGCLVLLHDICVTPYVLAWRSEVSGWLLASATVACLFWILDSALSFCTAYYRDGELVQTQPAAALHYLHRQFPIDMGLIIVDALNLVVDSFQQAGLVMLGDTQARLIRVFKLTRLLKLARALRMARLIDKLWLAESDSSSSSTSFVAALVAKILAMMIISNHILACVWFWQGAYGYSDTQLNWLEEGGWQTATPVYQYFVSLHWSVAQMTLGASDAMPTNSYERLLNIAFLINGLVVGSTTISYVSAAIVDCVMLQRDVTNQLLECRRFLRQYGCSQKLSAQVVKQVSKKLSEEKMLKETEVAALNLLAPTLRMQVQHETRLPHIQHHPLLMIWGEIDKRCLEALSEYAITHKFMSREDDLFQPGQSCDEAWHVVRGKLKYTTLRHKASDVAVVGVGTWVCEAALWSKWTHVGTMDANDKSCHLLSVNANAMLRMLQEFPTVRRLTQQYAKNYHAYLISARPPHSNWPSDLHVPFTEDVAMLLSQHVGLGLLKKSMAAGTLNLTPEDEAYLTKELMAGKCVLQYSEEDHHELERVVSVANVMLRWETYRPRHQCVFLYQLGLIDDKNRQKLSLHVPGTKRLTGESPSLALQRILDEELKPFTEHMIIEDSERSVSTKHGTKSLHMRTKTVKTIYRSSLKAWPSNLHCLPVHFPKFAGLDVAEHDILVLPHNNQVGLYAFLLPEQYEILERSEHKHDMTEWIAHLQCGYSMV